MSRPDPWNRLTRSSVGGSITCKTGDPKVTNIGCGNTVEKS